MLWSKDLKRHRRVLKRQLAIWACEQITISLILLVRSICFGAFRRIIWVLIYFRGLLSMSFSWIEAKARVFKLSLISLISICFSWIGATGRALSLSLIELASISFFRVSVRAHALGLSLKEVIQQRCSQFFGRLDFEETACDEKPKPKAIIAPLRVKHQQFQNRIYKLDKSSGWRNVERNRSAHRFFYEDWSRLREL